MKKDLKVLMLGWEFPPILNGGLGIASQGIAEALSEHLDITFILPKVDPDYNLRNINLIGLNTYDSEYITRTEEEIIKHKDIVEEEKTRLIFEEIEMEEDFFPYESEDQPLKGEPRKEIRERTETYTDVREVIREEKVIHEIKEPVKSDNPFNEAELYGKKLVEKSLQYAKYARKIAQEHEFDIIHAHDWMSFLAGMEIKRAIGKPLVLHVHSLSYDREGEQSRGWSFEVEKQAFNSADLILAVSNYTADVITKQYEIDRSLIKVVYNGLEEIRPFRNNKPFDDKLVLFLGRITGQKGPKHFMDIIQNVADEHPNTRFVVAGAGDELKDMIEKSADQKLAAKIHFTGFITREKVFDLFAISDVYVMPSVSEPFGLTALEATAFGVPVVMSAQSGAAEVLKGSLVANYWDIDKFAQNVVLLLEDDEKAKAVVEENKKGLAGLTWQSSADQIIDLYSGLA